MFGWFRRFPLKWLNRIPVPGLRHVVVHAYKFIDRKGVVSNYLADPQTLYEKWWPYRALRRRFFSHAEPLVSVIVATRNNETTIEKAVTSLMQQTHRNLEIIVIDDASTDGTRNTVRMLQEVDSRIRLVVNKRHAGTGSSRNKGLEAARGDYITFQDGDDYSLRHRIEMQVAAFRKFPSKRLVTCNYVRETADGSPIQVNDKRVMECVISMMFPRKEILKTVGYFDDLSVSEDTDYLERIKIAFGSSCHVLVFRTLYRALFRKDSSFFSDVEIVECDGQKVIYQRGAVSTKAYERVRARHQLMRAGARSVFVGMGDP